MQGCTGARPCDDTSGQIMPNHSNFVGNYFYEFDIPESYPTLIVKKFSQISTVERSTNIFAAFCHVFLQLY